MQCTNCGAALDASGVFPGGALTCVCGTTNVVPRVPRTSTSTSNTNSNSNSNTNSTSTSNTSSTSNPNPHDLRHAKGAAPGHLRCPRCQKGLVRAMQHGESVEACAYCEGAFIPNDALARIIETADANAPDANDAVKRPALERDARYVPCPRCGEIMARMVFGRTSGIIVDACRPHGTWFDRGELNAVVAFVAKGGLSGETTAAHDANPETNEATRMAKVATAALQQEMARDTANVETATEFVDDLLFVLFPGNQSLAWRTRRRRF